MKNILEQQIRRLEQKEKKLLNPPENSFMKSTISPVVEKVQSKIPPKLKSTLNTAFYKGFQLVFEKGSSYIEKTYDKEKIVTDFDVNNYAIDKWAQKRHMKRLDNQSAKSSLINTSFSAVEGGVLGLLGVGLPDIPLFLSVILKSIYEIALSYGFDYQSEEEKTYILNLICGAITRDEKQKIFDETLEQLGAAIDLNIVSKVNVEEQIKITAEVLSDALLTAKFVQGLPVVGVVGGIVNYNISTRISNYARIKYKKRYLKQKLME